MSEPGGHRVVARRRKSVEARNRVMIAGAGSTGRKGNERGFVLLATMALATVAIIGVLGSAVDFGRMYIAKNETQAYCDWPRSRPRWRWTEPPPASPTPNPPSPIPSTPGISARRSRQSHGRLRNGLHLPLDREPESSDGVRICARRRHLSRCSCFLSPHPCRANDPEWLRPEPRGKWTSPRSPAVSLHTPPSVQTPRDRTSGWWPEVPTTSSGLSSTAPGRVVPRALRTTASFRRLCSGALVGLQVRRDFQLGG